MRKRQNRTPQARLENAQSEKDTLQEEMDRTQATVARQHGERERWINEVEKLREELERSQATVGKAQVSLRFGVL